MVHLIYGLYCRGCNKTYTRDYNSNTSKIIDGKNPTSGDRWDSECIKCKAYTFEIRFIKDVDTQKYI